MAKIQSEKLYLLGEADLAVLRRMIEAEKRKPQNQLGPAEPLGEDNQRSGLFAYIPTDGIPARTKDETTGKYTVYGVECQMYQEVWSADGERTVEIVDGWTEWVFNPCGVLIVGDQLLFTVLSCYGNRIVIVECEEESVSGSTSESTLSESISTQSESTPSTQSESTPSTQSESTPSTQSESTPSTQSESTASASTQSESTPSTQSESNPSTQSESTPSTQSEPPLSQSDKSTAIVPAAWSPTGYTAWFTLEAPDVRFDDVITGVDLTETETHVPIDFRYLDGCDPNVPVSAMISSEDVPVMLAAKVEGGCVRVRMRGHEPGEKVRVVIRLSGIRKGFAGHRFPERTRSQFEANERFLRSAYPGAGR